MQNNKQTGFTLIELIVVIVILGILAATALPKFIDLSSDARTAVIKGVEASIRSAAILVYGKAAAKGVQAKDSDTTSVTVNGTAINLVCGYPTVASLKDLLELSSELDASTTAGTVTHTQATTTANCKVVYTPPVAAAGVCPSYTLNVVSTTSGC